jgi:putative hydrolase of the HAD superfamily
MRVTTVLFDLGNTLFHFDHAFAAALITRHGFAVTAADVASAEYHGKRAVDAQMRARRIGTDATRQRPYVSATLEGLGVPAESWTRISDALQEENARNSLWRVVHADTPEVLATLRARGFRLGVVSNADGRVPAALAAQGLAEHFSVIIDSHLVGVEKPDPRIFRLALDGCGAGPEETLFVGDIYEIDIVGARSAGLDALLLDPLGLYEGVDCERIQRLGQLLELLSVQAVRGQMPVDEPEPDPNPDPG